MGSNPSDRPTSAPPCFVSLIVLECIALSISLSLTTTPLFLYTQPWKTLCGFPPTRHEVTLLIPNGSWRPDTVITDSYGNEYFVLLDVENKMRSYEAIFGDLEGNRLVCVKRHLKKAFWKDGFYFCTYRPNYKGQRALRERDRDNKRVYPHSYIRLEPLKGRFYYAFFDDQQETGRTRLYAENQWLGMMMVCCTPIMRWGRFTGRFKKKDNSTQIFVDQWRNSVKVLPGQDVLAALCLAYIFDKCQSQPMVAVMGRESDDEYESEGSIDSNEEYDYEDDNYYRDHPEERGGGDGMRFENMPDSSQRDEEFDEEYYAEDEYDAYNDGKPYDRREDPSNPFAAARAAKAREVTANGGDPHDSFAGDQAYDPNDPNNAAYDPNYAYDPNDSNGAAYAGDPNDASQAYDPNNAYDPNDPYNQGGQPTYGEEPYQQQQPYDDPYNPQNQQFAAEGDNVYDQDPYQQQYQETDPSSQPRSNDPQNPPEIL